MTLFLHISFSLRPFAFFNEKKKEFRKRKGLFLEFGVSPSLLPCGKKESRHHKCRVSKKKKKAKRVWCVLVQGRASLLLGTVEPE